ncbi:MAG: hypothetical protein AAF411_01980 [Myxococcota bacterium]
MADRKGRRAFIRNMGLAGAAVAGAPILFTPGGRAVAQEGEDTIFIEINLRDQWDHVHFFVPPGVAQFSGSIHRGPSGDDLAFYAQPGEIREVGGVYLTDDSFALAPHVDTIAMLEFGEATRGPIHGHEAGNDIRSPGRRANQMAGYMPIFENDPTGDGGNWRTYSTVPTPASLHNYWAKQRSPGLRNGWAFKGYGRSNHTAYHFAAGLSGGELDRVRSKDELFELFPLITQDPSLLSSDEESDALLRLLGRTDARYFARRGVAGGARDDHQVQLDELRARLRVDMPIEIRLRLDEAETEFWSSGVPNQKCTDGDRDIRDCVEGRDTFKAQIWETVAYAFKAVASGATRTVSIEFDFRDLHNQRPEEAIRTQAQQAARPLARLIQRLKEVGLYDRTAIAIYTTDGSRGLKAGSYGNDGRNTVILAGGRVRGGYYGDIRLTDEGGRNGVVFHPPDESGNPIEASYSFRSGEGRLESARIWRTVTAAAGIPQELCDEFSGVTGARPYSYMLRS